MIDPKTDTVVWGMELTGHRQYGRNTHEVRPMAFEAGADGSTKRAFAQATGINAVWVIDWAKRQVVDLLWPPKLPLVATERRRHSDRRHARPRGAARSLGGVGVEPARQPHLRMEPARSEVHRRGGSRPERQLDDVRLLIAATCTWPSRAAITRWRWTCASWRLSRRSRPARGRPESAPPSCRAIA